MQKKDKYIIYLLIVVLIGCEKKEIDTINIINDKTLPAELVDKLKSIELIDSLFEYSYIDLETSDSVIIGDIKSFSVDVKENIYVVDKNQTLFKFNNKGKFNRKLLAVGEGPGEYLDIGKIITTENGNIIIEDTDKFNFILFDSTFNFIKNISKQVYSTVSDWALSGDTLICFYSLINIYDNLENVIYYYDLNSGEIIHKSGSVSQIHKDNDVRQDGGTMIKEGNIIYFQFPLDYQIYLLKNESVYKVFNKFPAHFQFINKKFNVYDIEQDYSIVFESIYVNDLLIIKSFTPRTSIKKGKSVYDIYGKDGVLYVEGLESKNLSGKTIVVNDKIWVINNYEREASDIFQRLNPKIKVFSLNY